METIINRLKEKVSELGNQKVLLLDQVNKLRQETESLEKKLIELEASVTNSTNDDKGVEASVQEDMNGKIDEMVKEIDKCIAILNID